jgi:hypothetical protein
LVATADLKKIDDAIAFLQTQGKSIPNIDRLIQKLTKDKKIGHLVNAEFAIRFHKDGTYKITDIEVETGTHDIDIQLDGMINIQTWHGQSESGHIMESLFEPNGIKQNLAEGNITPLGGVKTDWDKNEGKLFKKLAQIPDDSNLGILLLHERFVGFPILPEWKEKIPSNKCIIILSNTTDGAHTYGVAVVYCSTNFTKMKEVEKIISAAGYSFKGANPL